MRLHLIAATLLPFSAFLVSSAWASPIQSNLVEVGYVGNPFYQLQRDYSQFMGRTTLSSYRSSAMASDESSYQVRSSATSPTEQSSAATTFFGQIRNESNTPINYTLSIKLFSGALQSDINAALDEGEYLRSNFNARLLVNGQSLWQAGASISADKNGITGRTTGEIISSDNFEDGYFGWSTTIVNIDLGVILPTETIDFTSVFSSSAESNIGTYSYACNSGGFGGIGGSTGIFLPPTDQCYRAKGSAAAWFGDPNSFGIIPLELDKNVFTVSSIEVQAVPEPGSLALVGIAALAARVRRRRTNPNPT